MKLKDYLKAAQELIAEHPEAAEMEVHQTSCFDDPYRFETDGIFIGECFNVFTEAEGLVGTFTDEESAVYHAEENGFEVSKIEGFQGIVISAM